MAELNTPDFMAGEGEMGALMRSIDWDNSTLGPPAGWPLILRISIRMILDTTFPMYIAWGNDYIQFYNDGFRPILGSSKHPAAMGLGSQNTFAEIWETIGPMFAGVMEGVAVGFPNFMVPLDRNGYLEDCYFDFSYSPMRFENGAIGGILVTVVETTQNVKLLKRLEESNEQYEFALDAAQLATWEYNPFTKLFTANHRFREWFGCSQHGLIDPQQIMETILPADRLLLMEAVEKALARTTGDSYEIIFSMAHPTSGSVKTLKVKGRTYFQKNGDTYRLHGTVEDITDEMLGRQRLIESERNFRYLIQRAPVAMCVLTGPDYSVELANEKMISLWGREPEQVLHKPIFEGLLNAKDYSLESYLQKVYFTSGHIEIRELPLNLPDEKAEQKKYLNIVFESLRDSVGSSLGIVMVAIDVTEQVIARQQIEFAEERARLAAEAGSLGTFDYNTFTGQTAASARFRELFGVNETDGHDKWLSVIHPDDRPIRDQAMHDSVHTGKIFYEVRILKKEGSHAWIRVEGRLITDESKKVSRLLGTVLDITEKKEMDEKREEYIAIASHELRNPLTSLKLSLDLMDESLPESDRAFILGKSKSQVKRIMDLTHELLNVAKISSGILELNPVIFNLQDSIRESISTVQASVNKNVFAVSGNADISIGGDKFRVEQVLINLLSNASKYSPDGSPIEISVTTEMNHVKISVTDKGIGIDPEKLPYVFQKFIRIETNNRVRGYGLGLYISEQIVRKHGGTMGAESKKGKGSVFWFTLPH